MLTLHGGNSHQKKYIIINNNNSKKNPSRDFSEKCYIVTFNCEGLNMTNTKPEPCLKKVKREGSTDTAKQEKSYAEFVQSHPFFDNSRSVLDIFSDGVFRDAQGTIVGILIRNAIPEDAATMAAHVLRSAASKTSLRSNIYGGEPPNSGIAGYFDYRGSPITHKSRKTSFTYTNSESWPNVFPMVDYVNDLYRKFMPDHWAAQNASIPDIVRIHGSVFSTLTINSKFRTAHHTDVGDFDGGYSCIACLEGEFKGLALTFDHFKVSCYMRPRDIMIFNPHHFHSNTELEGLDSDDWSRLTCVFYYRVQLGEPWSYAEYDRRFAAALKAGVNPPPVVRQIIHKANGVHLNKSADVHSSAFTPFSLPICVNALRSWAPKALRVHDALLHGSILAELLFGEMLETPDGIPERRLDEKVLAINAIPNYFTGEATSGMLGSPEKSKKVLEDHTLAEKISDELLKMWISSLYKWTELVESEWKKQTTRTPDRTSFVWNNRSEMNAAFFELCDVAKEVMYGLFENDCVTKFQEEWFWRTFEHFLNEVTIKRLEMPEGAMSLTKLNVKVKDYHFGGTRYFKDMPPEEQRRRIERKRKIEEARKSGIKSDRSSDWLQNDSFDYQTEDREVDYGALNLPLPQLNTESMYSKFSSVFIPPAPEVEGEISVCVILPKSGGEIDRQAMRRDVEVRLGSGNSEYERLLGNPAAQRLQYKASDVFQLPSPVREGNITVTFSFVGDPIVSEVDFIILQHALASLENDEAKSLVNELRKKTRACLLVVETDALCRNFYTIKPNIRNNFIAAGNFCFSTLHAACYGIANPKLRTLHQIEEICDTYTSRFKFIGSPLNSVLYIIEECRDDSVTRH
eukprot:gene12052-8304_t